MGPTLVLVLGAQAILSRARLKRDQSNSVRLRPSHRRRSCCRGWALRLDMQVIVHLDDQNDLSVKEC